MKQAEIWANEDKQEIIPCDATKGLIRRPGRTLGLDIYGLAQMLSIPRQLRKGSPFQSRLLRVVPFRDVKTVPVQRRYYDKYDFDWPTVCKANFGIDVQWRPAT